MKPNVKKIAAIHDLSGFGRASLTVIIPTLSAMGYQVCPAPTAVLSTHSGGFTDYSFTDLTDSLPPIFAHWKKLSLEFDCIYSGFLGSPKQTKIVSDMIDTFKTPATLVVVDPVMGDYGALYNSIKPAMIPKMQELVTKADIIVPNYTESALLLNEDPKTSVNMVQLKDRLKRLSDRGPATVVITGVQDGDDESRIFTAAYQRDCNVCWKVSYTHLPGNYPGTGDVFASVMIGCLLEGESLPVSIDRGAHFISQCINASRGYDYPLRDGILLERELYLLREPWLISSYEEF
jgi:pyridoxine kinase